MNRISVDVLRDVTIVAAMSLTTTETRAQLSKPVAKIAAAWLAARDAWCGGAFVRPGGPPRLWSDPYGVKFFAGRNGEIEAVLQESYLYRLRSDTDGRDPAPPWNTLALIGCDYPLSLRFPAATFDFTDKKVSVTVARYGSRIRMRQSWRIEALLLRVKGEIEDILRVPDARGLPQHVTIVIRPLTSGIDREHVKAILFDSEYFSPLESHPVAANSSTAFTVEAAGVAVAS